MIPRSLLFSASELLDFFAEDAINDYQEGLVAVTTSMSHLSCQLEITAIRPKRH